MKHLAKACQNLAFLPDLGVTVSHPPLTGCTSSSTHATLTAYIWTTTGWDLQQFCTKAEVLLSSAVTSVQSLQQFYSWQSPSAGENESKHISQSGLSPVAFRQFDHALTVQLFLYVCCKNIQLPSFKGSFTYDPRNPLGPKLHCELGQISSMQL